MKHLLGALPSPHDYRDYPVGAVVPFKSYPVEHEKEYQRVRDQKVENCTACAVNSALENFNKIETGEFIPLSDDWTYQLRLPEHHQGEGRHLRNVLKMVQKYGVCREDLLAGQRRYDTKARDKFTDTMYQDALPRKLLTFCTINTTHELKNALANPRCEVIRCIPVYTSFLMHTTMNPEFRPHILEKPKPDEKLWGYHAIRDLGYGENFIKCLNSYSEYWGEGGTVRLALDYPTVELWCITDYEAQYDVLEIFIGSNKRIFNGQEISKMDVKPFLQKNRTCTPTRHTHEPFGDIVSWDNTLQKVTIKRPRISRLEG